MSPHDYKSLIHTALSIYDEGAKRTGRTHTMLTMCQDGDIVVCPNQQVASYVRQLAKDMGKDVTPIANNLNLSDLLNRLGAVDRVHYEHTWLEQFFRKEAESLAKCLADFQEEQNRRASARRAFQNTFTAPKR